MLAYDITHPVKTGRPHSILLIINEQLSNDQWLMSHKYRVKKVPVKMSWKRLKNIESHLIDHWIIDN